MGSMSVAFTSPRSQQNEMRAIDLAAAADLFLKNRS
jgi:hypothetical protein